MSILREELGGLTLGCMDCMEALERLGNECIDLVVTDPPYKIISGGDRDGKHSKRPAGILKGNRKLFEHSYVPFERWLPEVFRVLKDGSHCYIFVNMMNLRELMNESVKVGFKIQNLLVWEKNTNTPSQYYMKNCEYVLMLRKGRAKWINNIGGSKTVHKYNIVRNRTHSTEKPVDLLKFYIENSSNAGDFVLDPFMGTGSTGMSAIESGRNFVGIEIDENYYKIAEKKLVDLMVQRNKRDKEGEPI